MAENDLTEVVGEVPAIPAEEPEGQPPESEQPIEEPVDEPPDPAALKAEIEELERKKKEAQEAAKKWRQEKAAARADYFKSRQEPEKPTPPTEPKPPSPDDFDDYNQYVEALTDYKTDRKLSEWQQKQVERDQDGQHQQKMRALQEKITSGYEKYEDFEDVALAETVPITPMITEVLAETEHPEDIAYYLGKNHTEAIKISRMTPIAAARAIAKIEAEISNSIEPKKTKTSNAPPPIKPVGSGGSAAYTKDPDKMTQAEFEAWRESQGARRY